MTSRSAVVFTEYRTYLQYVERARPGDHFTLFSLDRMVKHAALRLGEAHSSAQLGLDAEESSRVHALLRAGSREPVLVRRFIGPLTDITVAEMTELGATDDEDWIAVRNRTGLGELFVFEDDVFDVDEAGEPITTVSPQGRRRVNALVDAKRPDVEGRVPLGGPY